MFNRMRAVTFTILLLSTASPVITINTAVAQTQSSTKIASTVLATANGQQLTQGMVDSGIKIGEFVAGQKFSQEDKRWIKELLIKNFHQNPNNTMQGYRFTEQILSEMKKYSQNPVRLALGRERLFRHVYFHDLAKNQVNQPSIMTIVYKYSPVIFADPGNNFVVTKRTIDSIYAPINFVAQSAGRPTQTPNYQGMAQGFPRYYKTISAHQKKNWATAESRWVRFQTAWSKSSPQQKQKIAAFINKQLKAGHDEGNIAGYLLHNANSQNTASNINGLQSKINDELESLRILNKHNFQMRYLFGI